MKLKKFMQKERKEKLDQYFPANVRNTFFIGLIFAFFSSLAEMIRPEIIARTIDAIADGIGEGITRQLLTAAIAIVFITFLTQLFRYLCQIFAIRAGENFVRNIRDRLFSHILRLPASWHSSHQTGDMIQRCTMDTNEIKVFITEQMINLLTMVLTILMALFFIAAKDWRLALFAFCSVPLMIGYSFYFHQKIGAAYEICEQEDSKLSVIAQDNLTGIRIIRAFGTERKEKERFSRQNTYATNRWIELDRYMCIFWVFADILTGLTMMGFLALGSSFCVHGELTVGNFTAGISYLIILAQPVRNMGRVLSEMSKAEVSLRRIDEILCVPQEQMLTDKLLSKEEDSKAALTADKELFCQDITFENVSFGYHADAPVLRQLSFQIKVGETIGILGNTGSGKSTIAELLTGMYQPDQGEIRIGGRSLFSIHKELLRKNIGLDSREGLLFGRSIRDNLQIGLSEVSENELSAAVQAACLDEAIAVFPDGLDTLVGERGVTLSGGQKQRAIIARTLLLDCPILILDDVLSAVDTETDAKIRENLKRYQKGRTVIIICHRVRSLMDADHILVLDQGRAVEFGSHKELMKQHGHYRKVFEMQEVGCDEE